MASGQNSISNIENPIESSFDVDVVGLADLVEFKSDGELFDFESGGEFGLFGEDGVPLQQSTSYIPIICGEKEASNGPSFSLSPSSERVIRTSPKLSKRPRKNKIWNEMEKDLFLKGLELFGENWRKISKFIATKTINQVKVYHKAWAETANVIPDSVNLANDSCIYLPLDNNDKEFFITEYNNPLGFIESSTVKPCVSLESNDPNLLTDTHASGSETDTDTSAMNFGEGMVVSSLHDWNLGSQVSVTEEASPVESPIGFGPLSIICDEEALNVKKKTKLKIERNSSKKKNEIYSKMKKRMKMSHPIKPVKPKLKKLPNVSVPSKAVSINEGQIIRLNKNESEDSDVNIDDSEDEDSSFFLLEKSDSNQVKSINENIQLEDNSEWEESKHLSEYSHEIDVVENSEFEDLSEDEKLFYVNTFNAKELEITENTYISIRKLIIKEWEKRKFIFISKSQFDLEETFELPVIHKIFDYLERKCIINFISNREMDSIEFPSKGENPAKRVLPKRKRNLTGKEFLGGDKLHSDMIKKGGGVTMSHDASGAIIDALHIPESSSPRSNTLKKNSTLQHLKLLNCLRHDPDTPAPFTSVLYPQAVITLNLHSHSSFSEVIGLLGGFLDERKRTLHISVAVPTKASSSGVHCEMCPLSQTEAFESIQENGMEVVGWYHSHPSFLPNPSHRDLATQSDLQSYFKKNDAPFVGLIISPYCPSANPEASVIRCFILDAPPSQHSKDLKRESIEPEVPYRLDWNVLNESELKWEEIECSLTDVLRKSKEHSNLVRWRDEWRNGMTYLDKFVVSLKLLLPLNLKELVNLIKDFVGKSVKV